MEVGWERFPSSETIVPEDKGQIEIISSSPYKPAQVQITADAKQQSGEVRYRHRLSV
jgi:hypothetical protein